MHTVDTATALVAAVGQDGLPQFRLNLIYELAFLRCVLAWEEFLLETMCAYLTGAAGLSGRRAKPRAAVATLGTAQELLIGKGPPFVSWTDKKRVQMRAKLWFDGGEPYGAALVGLVAYDELRIVRNRIVHDNTSWQKAFRTSWPRSTRRNRVSARVRTSLGR